MLGGYFKIDEGLNPRKISQPRRRERLTRTSERAARFSGEADLEVASGEAGGQVRQPGQRGEGGREEDFKKNEVRTKIKTVLCLPPLSLVKSFLLLGCLIFIGSQALVLRVRSFRDQKGDHILCYI